MTAEPAVGVGERQPRSARRRMLGVPLAARLRLHAPPLMRAGERAPEERCDSDMEAFWVYPTPALPPLLVLMRRGSAWRKMAKRAGGQFAGFVDSVKSFADSLPDSPDEHELAEMAATVRCACVLTSETRTYQSVTRSGASLTAISVGVFASVAFAIFVYARWSLTQWYLLPAIWLAELCFWLLARLFESYVFPGALRRGLGFPRWPHTARLYGRTMFWGVLGVASITAILTVSGRHDQLRAAWKLAIAAPLGCLAATIGLWCAVLTQAFGTRVRRPSDPYPELVLGLLDALDLVREGRKAAHDRQDEILTGAERCRVSDALERPAHALRAHASMCTRVEPELSAGVATALCQEGRRVAAWLGQLQAQVLWPAVGRAETVERQLAQGLIDACRTNWSALQRDPLPDPEHKPNALRKLLPRIALAVVLLAAAFVIPAVLSSSLSSAARTTLTVSLIVTALTALFTPGDAVSTVANDIYSLKDK